MGNLMGLAKRTMAEFYRDGAFGQSMGQNEAKARVEAVFEVDKKYGNFKGKTFFKNL